MSRSLGYFLYVHTQIVLIRGGDGLKEYPILVTERLFLRPFMVSDAKEAQRLGGDPAVVDTLFTLNLCTPGVAHLWICHQHEHFEKGDWVNFAITDISRGLLIGSVGLDFDLDRSEKAAEIMYWIGKPYWGRGYATEAARAVIGYGFERLYLRRIYARYLVRNPASGRVLEKIGMTLKARLPRALKKRKVFEDLNMMSMTREEFKTPA